MKLTKGNMTIPLLSLKVGWEDDIKKWPFITYSSIFSHFVESVDCDKAMSNLKSSEANTTQQ